MRCKPNHKGSKSGRSLSGAFVFLLIGMYAVFSLLLVLIGASVYQRIAEAAEYNAHIRTSLTYIASKVRAGDEAGAVAVETVDGVPVLVLDQRFDGDLYRTRIYYLPDSDGKGGALYELFVIEDGEGGEPVDLTDGERITQAVAFNMLEVNGGLELSITLPDQVIQSLYLHLRAQAQ